MLLTNGWPIWWRVGGREPEPAKQPMPLGGEPRLVRMQREQREQAGHSSRPAGRLRMFPESV